MCQHEGAEYIDNKSEDIWDVYALNESEKKFRVNVQVSACAKEMHSNLLWVLFYASRFHNGWCRSGAVW